MEETAAQVRARLLAAATKESPELVESLAKLPETHLPRAALIAREVEIQHATLRAQPWSFGFLLGRTTPHYARIVEALKDQKALDRGSLIAGFQSLALRLGIIVLINRLLLVGTLVSLILALIFRASWLPVAVVCLALQYFVFNNFQTLLNIRLFARLSLHHEASQAHATAVIVDFTE